MLINWGKKYKSGNIGALDAKDYGTMYFSCAYTVSNPAITLGNSNTLINACATDLSMTSVNPRAKNIADTSAVYGTVWYIAIGI